MKQIFLFMLSASVAFTSCSKNDDPTPEESNTITIDGTAYPTATIGTQTWTTVNYNGAGGNNFNNSSTNEPQHGKLYTYAEAKGVQLPDGWRLPTKADYEKLFLAVGGTKSSNDSYTGNPTAAKKLMSNSGWTATQGNNSSGFNAFPSGLYDLTDQSNPNGYGYRGKTAMFWISTIDTDSAIPRAFSFSIFNPTSSNSSPDTYLENWLIDGSKLSIRFVKDN